MNSKRSHEGYLLIDHRSSPGIRNDPTCPENIPICGEGQMFEAPTITCSHCQTIVIVNMDRTRPRNYCSKCDHYVCDNPGCNVECTPFRAILDTIAKVAARTEHPIHVPEQLNRVLSDPSLIIPIPGE